MKQIAIFAVIGIAAIVFVMWTTQKPSKVELLVPHEIIAENPTIIFMKLSLDLPKDGSVSIDILSEPKEGAGFFQLLVPDTIGIPVIPELEVKSPLPIGPSPQPIPMAFQNRSEGEYILQLKYEAEGRTWKSAPVTIRAFPVEKVKIATQREIVRGPYLTCWGGHVHKHLVAQRPGSKNIMLLDESLVEWKTLPFIADADKNGPGHKSGRSASLARYSTEDRMQNPRLVSMNRVKGTYKNKELSAEMVVGDIGKNRTEFAVVGEDIEIGYSFKSEYPGCELHVGNWRWEPDHSEDDPGDVILKDSGQASILLQGKVEGVGRLYCKVWLTFNGKTSNKVSSSTSVLVIDDSSIFNTRPSGADAIFIFTGEEGGRFRIVAGWHNEYRKDNAWFKNVRIEIEGGEIIHAKYPLPAWQTVGKKRIYSKIFNFTADQIKDSGFFRVSNADDK